MNDYYQQTTMNFTRPLPQSGGKSPVSPAFKHSIIVVFPHPLLPTIIVSGLRNLIVFPLFGEKDLIP